MTHLTETEFIDALDGTLPDSRRTHLAGCDQCGAQAAALTDALGNAAAVPSSEPSPLFWDHFSARVSNAITDEPAPASPFAWARRSPAVAWGIAASMATVLMVAALWRSVALPARSSPPALSASVAAPESRGARVNAAAVADDLETDTEWAIVRTAADGLGRDEARAAGIIAHPGSAERLVQELSAAERAELARILENEMKRSGA